MFLASFKPRSSARGLSLLETCIAVFVLATAVTSIFGLFVTSERMGIIAREEAVAMYAASEVINEMRSSPFSSSVPGEKTVINFNKETRDVNLDGPFGNQQRLSMGDVSAPPGSSAGDGKKVTSEMGVILITHESPSEPSFGDTDGDGDLDFPVDLNLNGRFDDVLNTVVAGQAFPMNLGGDNASSSEDLSGATSLMRIVPVAVVVRWNSMAHLERRVQILTLIVDRSGSY